MLENISIIIPIAPDETTHEQLLNDLKNCGAEIIISSEGTRAKSLNAGAVKTQNEFLWFLHADSRVTKENLVALEKSLQQSPDALHYFDLAFDISGRLKLNAWGANIRSHYFYLPYGDQGLCLSKKRFEDLGGYPEDAPYGEDLLFVRHAKKARIKLQNIPSKLQTSSRQYKAYGWAKLTLLRQWQLMILLRQKL
ncbi:MAG: hypothetical protein COA45_12235 [Zetaproteobacteria bacterium]|nr:MAG: hypothetical protein COA45_12235 [Zetaproteobacteria bacterium]